MTGEANTMKNLKVGVIGLGVGERHVRAYQALEHVEVSAICDIDGDKLTCIADRYGISGRHQDYRRLLDDPNIAAVSICSYDDVHCEQALAALAAGKHVMIEKPVALHRGELERLVRAQQDSGLLLSSNLILRRCPRFKALRDMVRAGDFGELFYMEADYLHQILWKITEGWRGRMAFYCVTYGGGIHMIDLMRWIAGLEVREVTAMAAKKSTAKSHFAYPDLMTSLLRFEGDLLAKSTTSFAVRRPQIHTLNIYGDRMSFENGNGPARLFHGDRVEDETPMELPYPGVDKGDLLADFIAAIRTNREPDVSAKDVFRVMDICFAAWESVQKRAMQPVSYTL